MNRIEILRERTLARKASRPSRFLARNPVIVAASLRATETVASWQVRRGLLTRDVLATTRFEMDEPELLAGRLAEDDTGTSDAAHAAAVEYLRAYPRPGGQTGHCELDFEPFLSKGIDGVFHDIRRRMQDASGTEAEACESFLYALEGLSAMIANAAQAAEAAARRATAERRVELERAAAACRHIAHDAPESFYEATQFVWLAILAVMHGDEAALVVPGHLDRTLLPFYEKDLERGALGPDEALPLLECLYLLINDYVPDGLAMSVMVGGRDIEGNDVTNDLSYLCLEAVRRTRMIYPTVGICRHEGTPDELLDRAIDLVSCGCPTPAFFGDETIQCGLRALDVPTEDACHYINSTCVEITPSRGSNVWVASPYISVCAVLLDELADLVEEGGPCLDFDAFLHRYHERLDRHIEQAATEQDRLRTERQRQGRKPLQSVFTRDCIARGRDIDDGGARYNWVECSFVGLANLADSLHVMREEVFGEGGLTPARLKAVLDADYAGHERERLRFLNGYPKYGQNVDAVDGLLARIVTRIREACGRHRIRPHQSPLVPGGFCWIMHERLGSECGATPDGRKAGFPFADGCGPAQGRERFGPTAAVLSTTSWEHSPMIGGLAFNMKFSRTFFETPGAAARVRDLVITFLRRGGFEAQLNVVDGDTLRAARAHPEAYRDLMVRIGGYADYFVRLSPEMQDEIIMRTEFRHA